MCECECMSVVYLGCLSWLQLQEFIVSGSLVVGMSRPPQYVHSICAYGADQYHMWRPIPPPQVDVRVWYDIAVIYLPSTAEAGSAQPLDSSTFKGFEIVFSPIVSNTGNSLVLLVAPYLLPRRTEEEKKEIAKGIVEEQKSPRNALMCAYGDSDPWKPDASLMEFMDQSWTALFLDCGHDDSKQRAIDTFWGCMARQFPRSEEDGGSSVSSE